MNLYAVSIVVDGSLVERIFCADSTGEAIDQMTSELLSKGFNFLLLDADVVEV